MIVRSIDVNNDWNWGKGKNDYRQGRDATAQSIKTRLQSFLGDCFFATNTGIDWFNLLGAKDQVALNLAVSAVILNTQDVIKITQLSTNLDVNRNLTIVYSAITNSGQISGEISDIVNQLLTESGDPIVDEDGGGLII